MSLHVSSPAIRRQVAAVPVRIKDGGMEVLLITSRETNRWIVPKGWIGKNAKPREVAALEAFEEAGLIGRIAKRPLGRYRYCKRLSPTETVPIDTKVFLMLVSRQADEWPEKGQRRQSWLRPDVAARLVEPGLSLVLRRLTSATSTPKPLATRLAVATRASTKRPRP